MLYDFNKKSRLFYTYYSLNVRLPINVLSEFGILILIDAL